MYQTKESVVNKYKRTIINIVTLIHTLCVMTVALLMSKFRKYHHNKVTHFEDNIFLKKMPSNF